VTEYPAITFKGSKFEEDGDKIVITGDLTMKGVTKEVSIPFDIQGPVANPSGGSVIGLEGVATINRQEWDISWNKSLDNGGFVVGDEVMLKINVEAHSE
jgi:polyisoprenoid-binding protein YceI